MKQTYKAFYKINLNPEFIGSSEKQPDLSKSLHISMLETLYRRSEDYLDFLDSRTLIIQDECHKSSFDKLFPFYNKNTIVIGATATPYRKGKKTPSLDEFYQDIVQEVDTIELIKKGFLSPARTFGVQVDLSNAKSKGDDYDLTGYYEENKMWHGVVSNWKRIAPNTKTLLFSANVDSSKKVCEEFNIQGYKAKHVDGKTPKKEREDILKWFDNTPGAIICNCGILNAGFDQPDIETVILYRATTSLPLYLQMCGRGSRTYPGKEHFNILDFGNNANRLGFWEVPRTWGLEKDKKRNSKLDAGVIKECPSCNALVYTSVKLCPYCDFEFKKTKEEEEEEKIAELQLLPKRELMLLSKGKDNSELVLMCKAKLISPAWVLHNKKEINDAREFCRLMGYKMPGYEYLNKKRYGVFRSY